MAYTLKHIRQIQRVIRAKGIQIQTARCDVVYSKCLCAPNFKPVIYLGTKGAPHLVLSALVHEYGHCESHLQGLQPLVPISKFEASMIKEERRAWRLGYALLRSEGIPVDETMKRVRRFLENPPKELLKNPPTAARLHELLDAL